MSAPDPGLRLNRFLARAGLGSRRAVEDLVRAGRVAIDGAVVTDLGRRVDPERDTVTLDGKPVALPEGLRVYAFHKPLDVVSTLRAQGGQPSLLPYRTRADLPERLVPVGRLDADTTGLLLWTDDGDLNQALCRPASGVWKTYEVTVDKPLTLNQVQRLVDGGLVLDGRPVRPCRMTPGKDTRHWTMELHEGRKRQIRRMIRAVGPRVTTLHRTAVGPVKLGLLRAGDFRRLTAPEVQALRDALGRR